MKSVTKNEYLILALIFILGFSFYLYILTRHALIYGIDGPYYLLQVEGLLETGRLKYGDPPLAFFIFAFFTLIFSGDITLGIRVGLALFSALSVFPIYFWVKKASNSQFCGMIAMFVCIFAAPHVRMMNDLLKNAVGIFFLLCFIYYLHLMAVENKNDKRNLLCATLFLLLTGITHILDFGVALLFLITYGFTAVLLLENWRKFVKHACILLVIVSLFAAGALIVFPSLFTDFFKGLGFLRDLFSEAAGEASPLLFLFNPVSGSFILPVLLVGAILSFHEWRNRNKIETLTIVAVTIVGTLLSFPLIPAEWLWRFLLMEFIPMAFILGYIFSKIEKGMTLLIVLFLCVFPLVLQGIVISGSMRPTIGEEDYHQLEIIDTYVPPNSTIIVDFRYGYWVEYVTGADIAKKPSPELWREYNHVFMLTDKLSPRFQKPPQGSVKIVETLRFTLYELLGPPLKS